MSGRCATSWAADAATVRLDQLPPEAHPLIRRLLDYWIRKRDGVPGLPGRQHIDPVEMGTMLPWLWIVTVVGKPPRFRYRLVGTAHIDALGGEPTGKEVEEAFPAFAQSKSRSDMVRVVELHEVSYRAGDGVAAFARSEFDFRERLALPLARDGALVDMILCITLYEAAPVPRWAVADPE